MAIAELDTITRKCACCGRSNMQRSVRIFWRGNHINLGVTCAGQWFSLDMSGNVYRALGRFNLKLGSMEHSRIDEILGSAQDAIPK